MTVRGLLSSWAAPAAIWPRRTSDSFDASSSRVAARSRFAWASSSPRDLAASARQAASRAQAQRPATGSTAPRSDPSRATGARIRHDAPGASPVAPAPTSAGVPASRRCSTRRANQPSSHAMSTWAAWASARSAGRRMLAPSDGRSTRRALSIAPAASISASVQSALSVACQTAATRPTPSSSQAERPTAPTTSATVWSGLTPRLKASTARATARARSDSAVISRRRPASSLLRRDAAAALQATGSAPSPTPSAWARVRTASSALDAARSGASGSMPAARAAGSRSGTGVNSPGQPRQLSRAHALASDTRPAS